MKQKILLINKIKITSSFGQRIDPLTGKQKNHNGIDIAAPEGTIVLSPVNAVVTNVYYDESFGGGLTVILRDILTDDRYGFCHLRETTCKIGDIIQAGQELALSGNTGRSIGPHLHFSHSVNVRWVNNQAVNHTPVDPSDKVYFEL